MNLEAQLDASHSTALRSNSLLAVTSKFNPNGPAHLSIVEVPKNYVPDMQRYTKVFCLSELHQGSQAINGLGKSLLSTI